jgi:hypothetical protein
MAGKSLKRLASSLFFSKRSKQSTTRKIERVFARARFEFSIRRQYRTGDLVQRNGSKAVTCANLGQLSTVPSGQVETSSTLAFDVARAFQVTRIKVECCRDERFVKARRVNPRKFFAELKRRNVYKVAVVCAVVAWLLVQVATVNAIFILTLRAES